MVSYSKISIFVDGTAIGSVQESLGWLASFLDSNGEVISHGCFGRHWCEAKEKASYKDLDAHAEKIDFEIPVINDFASNEISYNLGHLKPCEK